MIHCKECGASVLKDSQGKLIWSSIEDLRKYRKVHGLSARDVAPEIADETEESK